MTCGPISRIAVAAAAACAAAVTLRAAEADSAPDVDVSTLAGKVMCGYQGWFNTGGDGAERGWVHWSKGSGAPGDGQANFDIWPDVGDYGRDERFATGFMLADGKPAEVFSSYRKPTECLADPPQGVESRFIGEPGVPSDFYLRVTGEAGKLLRGERAEQPPPVP